jgi:hypothetical protein
MFKDIGEHSEDPPLHIPKRQRNPGVQRYGNTMRELVNDNVTRFHLKTMDTQSQKVTYNMARPYLESRKITN